MAVQNVVSLHPLDEGVVSDELAVDLLAGHAFAAGGVDGHIAILGDVEVGRGQSVLK